MKHDLIEAVDELSGARAFAVLVGMSFADTPSPEASAIYEGCAAICERVEAAERILNEIIQDQTKGANQ